jgi:hypothetical protein
MDRISGIDIADILPSERDILIAQGIPDGTTISDAVGDALDRALKLLAEKAQPVAIVEEIDKERFKPILQGQGDNEENIPLEHIYRDADFLALYAITLGQLVSNAIQDCFNGNDFALGSLLDSAASNSADRAVEIVESRFLDALIKEGRMETDHCVLSYSPGYCGWHVSAQQELFQYLKPRAIGISLNASCLMTPLKSVSGVLVAGKKEIHIFDNNYPFCKACTTESCRERMERLRSRPHNASINEGLES